MLNNDQLHINIISQPHQNPLQTKSLSRNLSGESLRSTKCIEEPLPWYRSIFFVISRAWWDKSVSERFKGKAVSLSVSPVNYFEGLRFFSPLSSLLLTTPRAFKWASHFVSAAWNNNRPPCQISLWLVIVSLKPKTLMPYLFLTYIG